jgi:DNA polymerase
MSKPLKLTGKPARVLSTDQLERLIEKKVRTLHLDYETFCELDLKKVGLDVYSAHPSCRVLMCAYRLNKGELQQWFPHLGPIPKDLRKALRDPKVIKWAFNAQFERIITRRVLKIKTRIRGWRCSMALAYMHCFAGQLEQVGAQVGLPADKQKLSTGKKLIKLFCMPQKITKNQPHELRDWDTDPEQWEEFCEYNRQDVIAEEAIMRRLDPRKYPIPDFEWDLYELDQLINDRGIPIDMAFVENVIWMSAERKRQLLKRMSKLTGCENPNSTTQLLPWLKANGYPADDLRADSVKKVLKKHEKGEVKLTRLLIRVLKLRQVSSLTSVNKAKTAKAVVGAGDCIRYMLQFGGASRTLRWAGRKVQTQNMKRTPKLLDAEEDDTKLRIVTDLIRAGNMLGLELMVGEPMVALSGCMRSMFRCPEGEEFQTADLKSIESAVIAWVTKCKRLLRVFRENRDPYKDFGKDYYGKPEEEITRAERNDVKPPALGCGFRMGPGKELENGKKTGLIGYAENMGVDMSVEHATKAVGVYRDIYEEIPLHWRLYEKAIRSVMKDGKPVTVGYVTFERKKPYLTIKLPSGRNIHYFKPRIEPKLIWTGKYKTIRDKITGLKKKVKDTYTRLTFTHMGRDNTPSGRNVWRRIESHGGVIIENIVQAIARDVLCVGMWRAHKAGFRIVGHAHDEVIARQRVGENKLSWKYLCEVLSEGIDWAPKLPLGAAGWGGVYYRKA